MDELGALSIAAFSKAFGLSRTTVYELVKQGDLRTFKVGKRRLISLEAADEWRRRLEAQTEADRV